MTGHDRVSSFARALAAGVAAVLLSGAFLVARSAAAQCIGDCNADGTVTIDELVTAANVSSAALPLSSCPSLDPRGDGDITIDELVPAVGNFLNGCVSLSCPATARVTVSILNRRGADVTATISGSDTRATCFPAASAKTSYAASVVVPGACTGHPQRCACDGGTCSCDALGPRCELTIEGLAPGEWRHAISVPPLPPPAPQHPQRQWRTGLLMGAPAAAGAVAWTAYRTVLTVTSERDDGSAGTFRSQVDAANAAARQTPVLIQFDHDAYAGPIHLTNPAPLTLTSETVIDGTDANGDPSALDGFASRTYPTVIELDPTDKAVAPGAMLRFSAPRSGLRGLYVRRILGTDRAIPRRDQDVVAFDRGAILGRVDTSKLDGGAAARRYQGCPGNVRAPEPATNPAQGKDCVDVEDTGSAGTRFAAAVTIAHSELRHCYDRPVKSQNAEVVLHDNWIHHNLRGGPFAQNPNGRLRATRNLIEANGQNCPRASICEGGTRHGQPCAPARAACPGPDDEGCGGGRCLPVDVSPDPSQCGVDATRPAAAQLSAERGTGAYLDTDGNVVRDGLAAGVFFRDGSSGRLRNDVICGMSQVGIQGTAAAGRPHQIVVNGVTSALNGGAGVLLSTSRASGADIAFGDAARGIGMNNAFTNNGVNFSVQGAAGKTQKAQNNQWQHGGSGARCDAAAVRARDVRRGSADVVVDPCQAYREPLAGTRIDSAFPKAVRRGELVHIYGAGFNAVEGYGAAIASPGAPPTCDQVAAGNTCDPDLRGTCVEFVRPGGLPPLAAKVVAVTPTHLVVESPLDCAAPIQVRVRRMTPSGSRTFISARPIFCLNDDVP